MSRLGRLISLLFVFLLPVGVAQAEQDLVFGSGMSGRWDWYIQWPSNKHSERSYVYSYYLSHGVGRATFSWKNYLQSGNDYKLYSSYGFGDKFTPAGGTSILIGSVGLEKTLFNYFVLDASLRADLELRTGTISPAAKLALGYRITSPGSQQSNPGIEIGAGFGSLPFPGIGSEYYMQIPYANGKKAITFFGYGTANSDVRQVGINFRKYRTHRAGLDIYTQFEGRTVGDININHFSGFSLSYGIGAEKVFADHYVLSGTANITRYADPVDSQYFFKPEYKIRLGYRF